MAQEMVCLQSVHDDHNASRQYEEKDPEESFFEEGNPTDHDCNYTSTADTS
jgi:hypothetical protein